MSSRIVVIGAGSTNFGLGIVGDFYKSKILEGSTLVLHDINAETLENTKNIALSYKEKLGVNFIKKPDDGKMKGLAFITDPDGYWIEILQANMIEKASSSSE